MKRDKPLDLFEDAYCRVRAKNGERLTHRECYDLVCAEVNYKDTDNENTINSRINRMEHDPRIASRILELAEALKRKNELKWLDRKEEVSELVYRGIVAAPMTLKNGIHDAVRSIGLLADLKGWREADRLEVSGAATGALDSGEVNRKLDALLDKVGAKPSAPDAEKGADA